MFAIASTPHPPVVYTDIRALRQAVAAARRQGKMIGLVPTMGALHAGHLSLVEACRRECGFTAVSVFVNPAQFGPQEDFQRYPRDLAADVAQLAPLHADAVLAPATEELYRAGHQTYVAPGAAAALWEGAHRPGHFRGVTTVVLKLFNIVQPDVAYFGRKDFQQSAVLRQMTADFDLPIEIRVCPTVREDDGLALSSRNIYLSAEERQQALAIHRSLRVADDAVRAGERDAAAVRMQMQRTLAAEPLVQTDYATLVDPQTLAELTHMNGPAAAIVAARVGRTRLIDNLEIVP